MLNGNHKEEGKGNEGATGDVNSPITANLQETGELSSGPSLSKSRDSVPSIRTSKSREGPVHFGMYVYSQYVLHIQNILLRSNYLFLASIVFLCTVYICMYVYTSTCISHTYTCMYMGKIVCKIYLCTYLSLNSWCNCSVGFCVKTGIKAWNEAGGYTHQE